MKSDDAAPVPQVMGIIVDEPVVQGTVTAGTVAAAAGLPTVQQRINLSPGKKTELEVARLTMPTALRARGVS